MTSAARVLWGNWRLTVVRVSEFQVLKSIEQLGLGFLGSELDALLHALGEPVPTATNHKLEIIKWALGIRNGRYK